MAESEVEEKVCSSVSDMLQGYSGERPWLTKLRNCSTFSEMLSVALTEKLAGSLFSSGCAASLVKRAIDAQSISRDALLDLHAYVIRDPATTHYGQPLLFFKGFHAVQLHRIAHFFWKRDERFLALAIQSHVSEATGVDIHPAVTVGHGLFLDHATGVVIGETASIGDNVSILHGVTLGGVGRGGGKRHPTIGNGVLIGAGVLVLGNIAIGDGAKLAAGCVVVKDVPPYTTVAGMAAKPLVSRAG
jgi:serine O-acetyltransferase